MSGTAAGGAKLRRSSKARILLEAPIGTEYGAWRTTGEPYVRLLGKKEQPAYYVPVRCSCGEARDIKLDHLRKGVSVQCRRCSSRQQALKQFADSDHHTSHPLYFTWRSIRARCYDPSHINYHCYGGRGIGMHEGWKDNCLAFTTWVEEVLGPRQPGKSLDRIDNNGDYAPGNLRWASAREQALNRRTPTKMEAEIVSLKIRILDLEAEIEALREVA